MSVLLGFATAIAVACSSGGGGGSDAGPDASSDSGEAGLDSSLADSEADSTLSESGANDGSLGDAVSDVAGDGLLSDGALIADAEAGILDGASDGAVSKFCGDSIRDPVSEECDDGVISKELDSCSSLCQVRDLVAWTAPTDASLVERYLGTGRHPVSAGSSNFAVAWVAPAKPSVGMTFYGPSGIPLDILANVGVSTTNLTTSSPVLAELGNGQYAVAWTDFGGDGDQEGIAIRIVDPKIAPAGSPGHANTTTSFSQYDADILWTGKDLVVAWADTSNNSTGPDIRYRTFDSSFTPTSAELTLAATVDVEDNVALEPFNSGWAAAWRDAANGLETVQIKSGNTTWNTSSFTPGPYANTPALAQLDSTHLLLVYVEGADWTDAGVSNGGRVRGAVLDTGAPGTVSSFDIAPAIPDAGVPLSAYAPNAMVVGSHIYVAWGTEAGQGDPNAEELWLKEIGWNGKAVDLTKAELPLPRWTSHRVGDQRFAALASSPLGPDGALVGAWNDLGKVFSNEANGDVAVELMPVPIVRFSWADGGGL